MRKCILVLLFISITAAAQNFGSVIITQDNKLAFLNDDYGNSPFTLDLSSKFTLSGSSRPLGFSLYSLKYEFADLSGGQLHRFGSEVGYSFKLIKRINFSPFLGYGLLRRNFTLWMRSWEFGAALVFQIAPRVKLLSQVVYTQRPDLRAVGFRMNANSGIQIDIFDFDWLSKQAKKGTRF